MKRITLVIVDFLGCPINRTKIVGNNFVFECGIGRLLRNISKYKAGVDFDCVLVLNRKKDTKLYKRIYYKLKEMLYFVLKCRYPFIKQVVFRSNSGWDIGAYEAGYNHLRNMGYSGDVVFMNSSVRGPFANSWLANYQSHFNNNNNIGLISLTMNSHNTSIPGNPFMPHAQSFFLYSNMCVMSKVFPLDINSAVDEHGKLSAIEFGEIGISNKVLDAGYSIGCMCFPDFTYSRNSKWTIPEGDLRANSVYEHLANKIL